MDDSSQSRDGRPRLLWRRLNIVQKGLVGIVPVLAVVIVVARSPWGVERRYPQLPPEVVAVERHVSYVRVVSDELGRAIASQHAISASRVMLTMQRPEADAVDARSEYSASVVVTFGEGYSERDADINAVVALVASAVEGLTVERVVVADSGGHILAGSVQ
jgi:hypothetical protein